MPATIDPKFIVPDDPHVKLWRYMDFTKFISMLESRSLFFCGADKLGDPFEGSRPKHTVESNHEFIKKKLGERSEQIPELSEDERDQSAYWMRYVSRELRQYTYISCWHMNQGESEAMWKIYTRTNESIAIQTTYQRLFDCLTTECKLGKVSYRDFHSEEKLVSESNSVFLLKRASFAHEQEIRAIIEAKGVKQYEDGTIVPNPLPGRNIKVKLPQLIEFIYVSPTAPKWFYELVKSITARYNLDIPVCQSLLDENPLF